MRLQWKGDCDDTVKEILKNPILKLGNEEKAERNCLEYDVQ